jgi:hypothetical protein
MEQIVVEDAEGNPTLFYPGKSSKVQTAFATAPLRTNPSSRIYTTVALLAADISAWFVSVVIMFAVRTLIWGVSPLFWGLWVCGAAWLLFRWASGLYPPTGLSQPDILRRSFRTTAAGAAVHLAILIAAGEDQGWRLIGLAIWLPVVPIAYFCRAAAYLMLRRSHLLGEPCVVIGTGEMARSAIREMQANSELGIIPIAIFSGSLEARISALEGVPVVGTLSDALEYPLSPSVQRAVIAVGRHEADLDASEVATKLARRFPLIQVLSELHTQASLLAAARSLGPYLVLEIRYGRFAAREKTIKRLFDLAIAVPVFLAALPIIGIAALLVKWASPGPAFFSQNREGLNGRQVRIWKIRTMVPDAEKRLAEYLAANPAARFEYERTLKLRQDPRVIPKLDPFSVAPASTSYPSFGAL